MAVLRCGIAANRASGSAMCKMQYIWNFQDENMKKSDAIQGQPASKLISKRIAELADWRGETLDRMRKLIQEADPDVIEEWKWMGTPVWCFGDREARSQRGVGPGFHEDQRQIEVHFTG